MKDQLDKWYGHEITVCVGPNHFLIGFIERTYPEVLVLRTRGGEETHVAIAHIKHWTPHK